MSFLSLIKRYKVAVIVISVVILMSVVGLVLLISILPRGQHIKSDKAISIARKKFGCDKILWIECTHDTADFIKAAHAEEKLRFGDYAYCIVGEKAGEELFIIVPADKDEYKNLYLATWPFDYSFTQIVEKFIELGASYDGEKFDKYPSLISLNDNEDMIKRESEYYCDVTGVNSDEFYARLDVKAIFSARWEIDYRSYNCIVAQENGELKAYVRVS